MRVCMRTVTPLVNSDKKAKKREKHQCDINCGYVFFTNMETTHDIDQHSLTTPHCVAQSSPSHVHFNADIMGSYGSVHQHCVHLVAVVHQREWLFL